LRPPALPVAPGLAPGAGIPQRQWRALALHATWAGARPMASVGAPRNVGGRQANGERGRSIQRQGWPLAPGGDTMLPQPSPPPSANGEHGRSTQRGRAPGQWRAPKRWWNLAHCSTRQGPVFKV